MRTARDRLLTTGSCLVLVLAACGGDGGADPTTTAESPADMEGMEGDDHGSFAFGHPGDAADADRTVDVEALDSLAFSPSRIEVATGETVTFVVTNPGAVVHEFVIGDRATQDEHAAEMEEMAGSDMVMEDEPNAIELQPGETKSITWTFTEAGELQYGCHQPGHFVSGMVGSIDVGS